MAIRTINTLLFGLLFLTGCQKEERPVVSAKQPLEVPYANLTPLSVPVQKDIPIVLSTKTLNDTIYSIERLQGFTDRPSYRSTLEGLVFDVFQKLATSPSHDTVIMTMFAASSCHHPISTLLSQKLLKSPHPIIQLCALQTLTNLNTTDSYKIVLEALRSDFPYIRLEAAYQLAKKRTQNAFFHLDALSYKLPPPFLSFMPELFALEGSEASMAKLSKMLYDEDDEIVIHTLLAIGNHHLTYFSQTLQKMQPTSPAVLEALAYALRIVEQDSAKEYLYDLLDHSDPTVQIQAAVSLSFLGEKDTQDVILHWAKKENPFAIEAIGELSPLTFSIHDIPKTTPISSINAAVSLLKQKNKDCLPYVQSIFLSDKNSILAASFSNGGTRAYWEMAPLHMYEKEQHPFLVEQSLSYKEALLTQALELEEDDFLSLAAFIFEHQCTDLYPCLTELLINTRSEKAIALLKQEECRPGNPFNRAFATVALYTICPEKDLHTLGPVLQFARQQDTQSYRHPLPWATLSTLLDESREQRATTKAKLYIDTIAALAESSSQEALLILTDELRQAPQSYLPFVCAAILQATL